MPVSSLARTTWLLNDTLNTPSGVNAGDGQSYFIYDVEFISNSITFTHFNLWNDDGSTSLFYEGATTLVNGSDFVYPYGGYWQDEDYKTITIIDCSELTEEDLSDFRDWLEANATQVVTPPTTYKYLKTSDNKKIQVDSAIRDGLGNRIKTTYAKKSQVTTHITYTDVSITEVD